MVAVAVTSSDLLEVSGCERRPLVRARVSLMHKSRAHWRRREDCQTHGKEESQSGGVARISDPGLTIQRPNPNPDYRIKSICGVLAFLIFIKTHTYISQNL